ncbi:MAG TPA: hypothetical protein VK453_16225 [Micromonosporaceae bacterium]|nr:hypothetical protein [Micromonosporaceae bacterium]
MSPRRNLRRRDPGVEFDATQARRGVEAVQSWDDGDWKVRTVPAGAKAYRCPGCDHEIRPGVPHVVAWPADGRGGESDRRHWHGGCWRARDRRGPVIQRSRSAPRYG